MEWDVDVGTRVAVPMRDTEISKIQLIVPPRDITDEDISGLDVAMEEIARMDSLKMGKLGE